MAEFKYSVAAFVGWMVSQILGVMTNFVEWLPIINGFLQMCVLLISLILALIGLFKSLFNRKTEKS